MQNVAERRDENRGKIIFKSAERKSFLRWRNILVDKIKQYPKKFDRRSILVLKINEKRGIAWPSDMVQLELYRIFGTKHNTKVLFFKRLREVVLRRLD
ncbi:MAG: hypothetical protein M1155_02850 [Patescibacteria group bacterium]|jgi:hypothetical protein|nr:hypothetical protein [Patescibacteria group bacterium]